MKIAVFAAALAVCAGSLHATTVLIDPPGERTMIAKEVGADWPFSIPSVTVGCTRIRGTDVPWVRLNSGSYSLVGHPVHKLVHTPKLRLIDTAPEWRKNRLDNSAKAPLAAVITAARQQCRR